jgi:hypothetical protein
MVDECSDMSDLDASVKICRYMNFAKFFLMLRDRSLYFCRSDKFRDPLEGVPTARNIEICCDEANKQVYGLDVQHTTREELDNLLLRNKPRFFINCWNRGEGESREMWKEYASDSTGICICSNFNNLKKCFKSSESSDQYEPICNFVSYLDREKALVLYPSNDKICIPDGKDYIHLYYTKDKKSFTHENEIRAIIELDHIIEYGINVKVSLDTLIEKVLVRNNKSDWFFNLVKLLVEEYGLDPGIVDYSGLVD